ncbi:MAG TPA: type II secretion system protein GspG [Armatimonadetes bacterium]|nr:type II secretion system protein GspG [Armatimonadota bacterium]
MYRSRRRGLTPLETLLIAALIAAFVLTVSWRLLGDSDHDARRLTIGRVETLMTALERYAIDNSGVFPTTDQGLSALLARPKGPGAPVRWDGPYVEDAEIFNDAWGAPLQYVAPVPGSIPYHLWSSGADRAQGGQGADADIKSWDRPSMVP